MPIESNFGDTHNFGRAVRKIDRHTIFKPRPIFWEWLVLSNQSPFRKCLENLLDQSPVLEKNFLPELKFGPGSLHRFGAQELVTASISPIKKLSAKEQYSLCLITGQLLAISCWLGIEDLHIENLALGRSGPNLKFGPVDVEIIFSKIFSPTDTLLIPSPTKNNMKDCGIRRILPLLGQPLKGEFVLACLQGYVNLLTLIQKNQKLLLKSLRAAGSFHKTPIRYVVRPTAEYAACLTGKKFYNSQRELLIDEVLQMDRSEIPYFFRTLDAPRDFYYYANPSLTKTSRVSAKDIVIVRKKLTPLINLNDGWSNARFKEFLRNGTMHFFSSMDHKKNIGYFEFQNAQMKITKKEVRLVFPNSLEIWSDRNWSQFCGHIYTKTKSEKNQKSVLISI